MKNKIAVFVLLFCTHWAFGQRRTYPPTKNPDRILLSLTEQPHERQSVTWRTDRSVKGAYAQIAEATGSPDFREKADSTVAATQLFQHDYLLPKPPPERRPYQALYHTVTFENLKPATKYAYRVGDGQHWSEWFHFTTAGSPNDPIAFLYFGDAQNELKSMWSRVIREAYSTEPHINFILHAGDLVNRSFNDREWGEWFYAAGWINGMVPTMATPGNHEYDPRTLGQALDGEKVLSRYWPYIFEFPRNGPKGPEELQETVYYVDYQDLRIISLNSAAAIYHPEAIEPQLKWLEEVLQNNPQKWTIVTHHHPLYAARMGRDNSQIREALQPLYEKYGVDLVLQGHDHTYGRGSNKNYGARYAGDQGPIYVVSVSGPKMYNSSFGEWVDRTASNTQLYQLIRIDGDRLRYEAFTAVGQLYDAFAIQKDAAGNNIFTDQAPEDVQEIITVPKSQAKKEKWSDEDFEDYQRRYQEYVKRKKGF
ncbi:MAG: metallophosphoesterase family protein [Bacteroidota bacterium]